MFRELVPKFFGIVSMIEDTVIMESLLGYTELPMIRAPIVHREKHASLIFQYTSQFGGMPGWARPVTPPFWCPWFVITK